MTPLKPKSNYALGYGVVFICLIAAAIVLRVVALDSDAFPGLSWSSALLTDEGFYIHNARNVVLFGTAQTDQFNNMLIMPALHILQVVVFHLWGVGAYQARMITVVASLVTLPLFFVAVDRSLGRRTALTATVFLALDHVYFLYNRLALMDSPATSVLIVMLYLWVTGLMAAGWRRKALMFATGMSLVIAYTVRGLAAPVCITPFAAMWLSSRTVDLRGTARTVASRLWTVFSEGFPIACGLVVGIVIYALVWYLPNRAELGRVDHYYFNQLLPGSFRTGVMKTFGAVFGNARGMTAYLIRHSSTVFILALAWILALLGETVPSDGFLPAEDPESSKLEAPETETVNYIGKCTLTLAAVWLLTLWIVFATTVYSPSRYYVLCYPAMSILAAHALWNMPALFAALVRKRIAFAFLVCIIAYHATLVLAERGFQQNSSNQVVAASIVAVVSAFAALLVPQAVNFQASIQSRMSGFVVAAIGLWAAVNIGWTCSWLCHLTYRQRGADKWLSDHLPANSVLFGAVAPGLCMNNHFHAECVIQGLCNDVEPLQHNPEIPRYVLILDDDWREGWWDRNYPGMLTRTNRVKSFPELLRPRFVVGVYKVPDEYRGDSK